MVKPYRENAIWDGYIDLSQHSLLNAVAHPLSTTAINALPSPVGGQLAYDSTLFAFKFYNGSAWTAVASLANKITDFTAPTAALPMNSQKITGLGVGTASGDSMVFALNKVTDLAAPSGQVSFNTQKLTIGDGTAATDAVTKGQLDAVSQGVFYKAAAKGASTANLTVASALVNGLVHDGVTYSTGDRILLKDQTAHQEDGTYLIVASGAASRTTDMDVVAEAGAGATVFVDTGTVNGNTQWTQTNTLVTLGTTVMSWVKTFQSADLTGAAVPKKYSGLYGNGTAGLVYGTPGTGTGAIVVTHSLGLAVPHALTWSLVLASTGGIEDCEMQVIDGNSFAIWGWATAPTSSAYRVTAIG